MNSHTTISKMKEEHVDDLTIVTIGYENPGERSTTY
jgi:hypothetical protein